MQRQLQKFGFFLNKDLDSRTSDKKVKYLFKNENNFVEKPKKRKIKSADESKRDHSPKKYDLLDRHTICERKKSVSSLRHSRKKSLKNLHLNCEGAYFVPLEDTKKHRRKLSDCERKSERRKQDEDKEKSRHKEKHKSDEKSALTKYDILKLLKNTKELPPIPVETAKFLKNFLVMENLKGLSDPASLIAAKNKLHRSKNAVCEDNAKRTELIHFSSVKKPRPNSVDILYSHDLKNEAKLRSPIKDEAQELYKRKSKRKDEDKLIFEELKIGEDGTKKKHKHRNDEERRGREDVVKKKPVRQKMTFKTFAVVEIPPTSCSSFLERKKQMKAYRKYYKYNNELDRGSEVSSAYHTFSDSHKLYQDKSQRSMKELLKKESRQRRRSTLRLVTNVSSVAINPEPQKSDKNVSTVDLKKKVKAHLKLIPQRSKIPVLTSTNKIVELVTDSTPTPKSHRKSSQLFNTRRSEVASQTNDYEEKHKKCIVSRISNRTIESPISSTRSNVTERTSDISEKSQKLKGKKFKKTKGLPVKESKVNRSATVSKLNKEVKKAETKNVEQTKKTVKIPSKPSNTASIKSSKSGKKLAPTSNSDTKIQGKSTIKKRKLKGSTRSSLSNSTFGDKSVDSNKNAPSFLVTKIYKDSDKLNRWQKRKLYGDTVRKNVIAKQQKSLIPPQIMEVRYLTVTKDECPDISKTEEETISTSDVQSDLIKSSELESDLKDDEFQDLPEPCMELVENEKFEELFALPVDEALNEILSENNNFLNKNFNVSVDEITKLSVSDEDFSSDDVDVETKLNEWCSFKLTDCGANFNDIFCTTIDNFSSEKLTLDVEDPIIDSLSAPGSEESGYETIKTAASFFEHPDIKLLINPPCFGEFSLEIEPEQCDSKPGLEIYSIESKCLQAKVDCSQKFVQTQFSQEELSEMISFSEQGTQTKCEEEETVTEILEENTSHDDLIQIGTVESKNQKIKRKNFLFGLFSCFKSHSSD